MSEEKPDLTPMSSPANDIRKLKANSAATADELTTWLAKMRGQSPSEVIGQVAKSGLFKSIILSTFLMTALILAWTAAAWGYDNYVKQGAEEVAPDVTTETTNEVTATPIPDNVADPNQAEMPTLDVDGRSNVADKLGIGEVKEAPAKVNPMDNSDDDLLEGLE